MKLIRGSKQPAPAHVIVDNWYTPEEEKRIWKELDFYTQTDKFERAEWRDIARDINNNPLGQHFRIHLDKLYTQEARNTNLSDILTYFSKLQTPDFGDKIKGCSPFYSKTFFNTNISYSFVSYYENNDYYKPHFDTFFWTVLIWFYKEPKAFEGGDLIFPEYMNYRVKCKHNRMIAFPCYYLHGVETIQIPEDKRNQGLGRYTITHFFHFDSDRAEQKLDNLKNES